MIDRRSFLKSAGATLAAATIAGEPHPWTGASMMP